MAKSKFGITINATEIEAATGGNVFFEKLPNNLVDSEGVVSPALLAEFVADFAKSHRVIGKDVNVILPSNATFFRSVESPALSDSQIKLNLPFEFRDFVGEESYAYNYDYVVESNKVENGKVVGLNLLAAAGKKEVVDNYATVLKKAGYNLNVALPNEMAIINVLNESVEDDKEYCLIGLDYDSTMVYITKGSSIVASKTIDLGMKNVDEAISRLLDVDAYVAASYRDANHDGILDSEEIKEVYEQIALEVMKTINFYKYEFSDTNLDKAYFYSIGSENDALCNEILEQVDFNRGDISELLPSGYSSKKDAARCLLSIGSLL